MTCPDSWTKELLLEAIKFFAKIEGSKGLKVSWLEKVALRMGFIYDDSVITVAKMLWNSCYR